MSDLSSLPMDINALITNNDSDAGLMITLVVIAHLQTSSLSDVIDILNTHSFETQLSTNHLFLSIEGVKLRIPLRPLLQGDTHAA